MTESERDGRRGPGPIAIHEIKRFVALGDSQTEGLHDYHSSGVPRGWADRLAEGLATRNPDFLYANLAVRGRRVAEIRRDQLGPALALEPDLATVVGGVNDLIRPRADVDATAFELEEMYLALRATGCEVVGCTFPLPSIGLTRRVVPRLIALNAAIREAAQRHDVILVEMEDVETAADPRIWSSDRIHLNPDGHRYLANAFERLLESGERWDVRLPPTRRPLALTHLWGETMWIVRYLLPKIVRVVQGRSSGDGRVAKRPNLMPLDVDSKMGPIETKSPRSGRLRDTSGHIA